MRKLGRIIGLAVAIMGLTFNLAQAALVTSAGDIPGPQSVVDFSQFTTANGYSATPVQVGGLVSRDITMTEALSYGNTSYSLGYFMHPDPQNGYWSGPAYTTPGVYFAAYGSDSGSSGAMVFHFNDGPVQAVGAFVNYDPYWSLHPTIAALDINGMVLESYDLANDAPISTPSQGNAGAFCGIARPTADIYGFSYGNGYVVLTDLTFTNNPVPVPGAVWLLGSGLLGLVGWRRKMGR